MTDQYDAEGFVRPIIILKKDAEAIAKSLHYPGCWDTTAYPTVQDAFMEYLQFFVACNYSDCHKAREKLKLTRRELAILYCSKSYISNENYDLFMDDLSRSGIFSKKKAFYENWMDLVSGFLERVF